MSFRMRMYSNTGERTARPPAPAAPSPVGTSTPDVPDNVLRDFYQSEIDRSSFRKIEDRIGVGRTTLAKFLQGSTPTRRIKQQLIAGCLGDDRTDRYRGALALLAGEDARMQRAATGALVDVYRSHGQTTPLWLTRLRDGYARQVDR